MDIYVNGSDLKVGDVLCEELVQVIEVDRTSGTTIVTWSDGETFDVEGLFGLYVYREDGDAVAWVPWQC